MPSEDASYVNVETVAEAFELVCPKCGEPDVFDVTLYVEGIVVRQRECVACGTIFEGVPATPKDVKE